eukprot:Nitzschia sp. Nitz4//scaffold3_size479765//68737//72891//NITZ4_000026-RA/size479765-processed-gene-0.86-mRNA-1//-1//CDS//3329550536//8518//frame0
MKNLVQLGESRNQLLSPSIPHDDDDSIADIYRLVSDGMGSGPSNVVLTKNGQLLRRDEEERTLAWSTSLEEIHPGCDWFQLAYVDPELVCLSRNGAIVTVSLETGEAELVGVFDYGLEAAAWSPDREVLLMVTSVADEEDEAKSKSVLMTMNSQFEVLSEVNIPTFVSSRATAESTISLAWRPDGTLCAMSAIDADDSVRKIRIYKRDTLEMHALGRSEDASGTIVKNLQDATIGWAGPGCSQVLAAVQRKGKKAQQVVFFESNGLRHREYVLREAPTTQVTSLQWNVNSDLLALGLREDGGMDKVQLWHRCNYHWYMKQELQYPGQRIQSIQFDEEKASHFTVVLQGKEWRDYHVQWDPSTTLPLNGKCPAFVVDGSSLNVTPLEKAIIPPPMSMNSITLSKPIAGLSFCRGGSSEGSLILQLAGGDLVFLVQGAGPASYEALPITLVETVEGIEWGSLRSITVVGGSTATLRLVGVSCMTSSPDVDTLVEIEVSGLGQSQLTARMYKSTLLEQQVLRIVNWADSHQGCLVELVDGALLEFEAPDDSSFLVPSNVEPLLEPCPWLCAIKDPSPFAGEHDDGHSRLVFGLSARNHMFFHDMMLSDSVSSFYLSLGHEFLCFATTGSRCFLRFLPLKEIHAFDPLMGLDQNHVLEGYEPRSVERGARIVGILPSHPTAILQMPRGNLEGIYPRALVLRFVMLQIAKGQYGDAFRTMRKHKVDLNLLVDFDPWHFYDEGIASFLRQVPVIDHLNLFLSGLQNWDITATRFPVPVWLRRENKESKNRIDFDFTTKVNLICTKARTTMMDFEKRSEVSEGHFLLPVLSTFAKETPPKLNEALSLIRDRALEKHMATSKKPALFGDTAQKAIHYLAFLAEYELLFETALGMYDFDMARAVARNSQMDPKVYLPLLKRLNDLPTHYARYEVEMRLGRFDAALRNHFASLEANESLEGFDAPEQENANFGNAFDDTMHLIETQKLHTLGLQLFKDNKERRTIILLSLGEQLLSDGEPSTALSVFLSADPPCHEGARRAARNAADWKTFFSLSTVADKELSDDQKENEKERQRQISREVASEMVLKLESESVTKLKQEKHSNAARILLDYGDDVLGAVDLLIKAQCWHEGRRVATHFARPDLVKKCCDGAIEFAHLVMEEFHEKASTFETSGTKYTEVLNLRKKNVYDGEGTTNEAEETGSLFSSASNMSNMSLQSSASAGSAVSSIISVKTTTTFTMTGDDEVNRHRSKFNKGKRQKTKKKKGKNRRKPGSQEELTGLVTTLTGCCPNPDYAEIIGETIRFLVIMEQMDVASTMYIQYNKMAEKIDKYQTERRQAAAVEKAEADRQARGLVEESEEMRHILVELAEEDKVDALACAPLAPSLVKFFEYLSI